MTTNWPHEPCTINRYGQVRIPGKGWITPRVFYAEPAVLVAIVRALDQERPRG